MKTARAIRDGGMRHRIEFGENGHHTGTADEPKKEGGTDEGPSPQELLAASLASCSAITMEMYASRKGWDIGDVVIEVNFEPAQRGSPTTFDMVIKLPKELSEDQRERLMHIVARCPVHRTLEGEVIFSERVELI
jgi:putative redox protein